MALPDLDLPLDEPSSLDDDSLIDAPEPSPWSTGEADLASALQGGAALLAQRWRARLLPGNQVIEQMTALDDLVEPLLLEIGRSLEEGEEAPPTAAWQHAHGLLRLSLQGGERNLIHEFEVLRHVIEEAAEGLRASRALRARAVDQLDAAEDQARLQLQHRIGLHEQVRPLLAFGGLVVEVP